MLLSDDPAEAEAFASRSSAAGDRRAERQRNQTQALAEGEVDLDKFFLDPLAKHTPGIDLRGSIVGEPMVTRTIMGASNISVPIYDPDAKLLRSELLESEDGERLRRKIDVNVDGLWFRLDGVDGAVGGVLELVFIARPVAQLIDKTRPVKARRADASFPGLTRAQFARSLVRDVGEPIGFVSPEIDQEQPTQDLPRAERRAVRDAARNPGLDRGARITVLGRPATAEQRQNIEIAMSVADEEGVERRVRKAMVLAGIAEGQFVTARRNPTSGATGPFQVLASTARYLRIDLLDVEAAARIFLVGKGGIGFRGSGWFATRLYRSNPSWSAAQIAAAVEGAGVGISYLTRWESEAETILTAWGGGAGAERGGTVAIVKPHEFAVGPPDGPRGENYWEALQRHAEEVNWRCFESGGRVYFISEDDLFKSRVRATVRPSSPGIEHIEIIDWLRGRRVQEVQVTARIGRWGAPPGALVRFEDCGPINGKWLVTDIERPVFSSLATITVQKPEKPRLEPPNEIVTRTVAEPPVGGSGQIGKVYGLTSGLLPDMLEFLKQVAGNTEERIVVASGRRNDPGSNHHRGAGADLDVGGDARTSQAAGRRGDSICVAVLVVCGMSRAEARKAIGTGRTNFSVNSSWKGHSVEVGWRTMVGGNHHNHIHVGFDA